MLSVPPLVVDPAAPGGALNNASVMAMISDSIFRIEGKTEVLISGWH